MPFIDGYKPSSNYQQALRDTVLAYLEQHEDFVGAFGLSPAELVRSPEQTTDELVVSPPHAHTNARRVSVSSRQRAQHIDYLATQERNAALGEAGEELVFDWERSRLRDVGRGDLADRVEWTSKQRGDGMGYDIQSFDPISNEKCFIEVKTTNCGKLTPFFVTAAEVAFSADHAKSYRLIRLFAFSSPEKRRLYELRGELSKTCVLTPAVFVATL